MIDPLPKLFKKVRSFSGGFINGFNSSMGYSDNSFGMPSWITIGVGPGLIVGGSYGWGRTYRGWFKH